MLLKFAIIWMRKGHITKFYQFFGNTLYISNDIKSFETACIIIITYALENFNFLKNIFFFFPFCFYLLNINSGKFFLCIHPFNVYNCFSLKIKIKKDKLQQYFKISSALTFYRAYKFSFNINSVYLTISYLSVTHTLSLVQSSAGAVEYTDCISAKG